MVLTPRLDQRQSQSLVMTPQLQQAIKLLQLSNIELIEFVDKEIEANPMLEREEVTNEERFEASEEEINGLPDIDFDLPESAEIPVAKELDVEIDNVYTNDSETDVLNNNAPQNMSPHKNNFESQSSGDIEQTLTETVSLRAHLTSQASLSLSSPQELLVASYLIDLLDDTGYLTEDLNNISENLGCNLDLINSVLTKLQEFDPPGIFAQNLRECLALQLRDRNSLDPFMKILLNNLDLLAEKKFTELAKICHVDKDELNEMLSEIRALNPKPGSLFEEHLSETVVPDVFIRHKPGGGWLIELNTDTLPKVLVNNDYHAQISSIAKTKQDKLYISQQFQSANWLIKALHQRATTTVRVVTELVKQQNDFLLRGVNFLKPLVLNDIAQAIDMHESTISRVTTNKYVSTPRGTYELKYFFTSGIASTTGSVIFSAESIRNKIKVLINNESPKKILSDDKIVTQLKLEGVEIARRTVTKYRESMRIPSSVQRRRLKGLPT